MTETIVSVIIPTYKPKAYLWNCIDSIYRQTIGIENIELLIVVNGCGGRICTINKRLSIKQVGYKKYTCCIRMLQVYPMHVI